MTENIQQQLVRDLVLESLEALDEFDRDLLSIEKNEADTETLHRIFRAIHSLKGTSGCLGLKKIEQLAHAGENLLSLMREGRLAADANVVGRLFSMCDALRQMLASLESTGTEGEADQEALISALNLLHLA